MQTLLAFDRYIIELEPQVSTEFILSINFYKIFMNHAIKGSGVALFIVEWRNHLLLLETIPSCLFREFIIKQIVPVTAPGVRASLRYATIAVQLNYEPIHTHSEVEQRRKQQKKCARTFVNPTPDK